MKKEYHSPEFEVNRIVFVEDALADSHIEVTTSYTDVPDPGSDPGNF